MLKHLYKNFHLFLFLEIKLIVLQIIFIFGKNDKYFFICLVISLSEKYYITKKLINSSFSKMKESKSPLAFNN